jgi:putative methyltransferase (TIGR04325 family)
MTTCTNVFKYTLLLLQGVIHKLILYLNSPLTYTPEGWETVLPSGDNTGWDSDGVCKTKSEQWASFCCAVAETGPLGFSHEQDNLTVNDNVSSHNVNISFGYVLARAAYRKTSLSVLDYGGGLGHYYKLAKSLLPDLELHYTCKDLPRMVAVGKRLNPDAHWYTDDSCLDATYDLVIISGSLQYIRHWQQFLCDVAAATDGYLLLARLPVVNNVDSFVAIQQTYNTRMLHWQFNRAELLRAINDAGFTIIREILAGDCPHIKKAPEQCDMRSWLLKKTAPGRDN